MFRIQTLEARPGPHQGPVVGIDAGVNIPLALSRTTGTTGDHLGRHRTGQMAHPEGRGQTPQAGTARPPTKKPRKPSEKTSRRFHHTYDQISRAPSESHAPRRRTGNTGRPPISPVRSAWIVVEAVQDREHDQVRLGDTRGARQERCQKGGLNRAICTRSVGPHRGDTDVQARSAGRRGPGHRPDTSRRCSACRITVPGSRETQSRFVCKNPDVSRPATPTGTPPGTSCTCTGSATPSWRSRPPEGAVAGRAKTVKPVAAR